MSKIHFLFLLFSCAVFSQDLTYEGIEILFKNNQYQNAKEKMQNVLRKRGSNSSKYLILYANILKNTNQIDSSLHYYNLVEKDFTQRNIRDSLLLVSALKLEFYRFLGYRKESEMYAQKLNQFELSQIKNKDIVAFALNRKMAVLSLYHISNNDTVSIIKSLGKQILDLESQITKKEVIAYTLNELALTEDYRGDKIKAHQLYEDALNYAIRNNLSKPKIDVSFIYAQYSARYEKDNHKAIKILEAIENEVLRNSNLFHKQMLYYELRNYYYFIGDYLKAYEASNQYFKYFQEIDFNESILKLNEIEKKFDIAEKQKEIQDKEVKIKIQNLEITNSNKRFWLICSFFGFTVLGSLALFFFFKREKKTNKELRVLSKENEFLMSEANHRINNNLQLIIILIEGQVEKMGRNESSEIKKILVKINSIATLHKHLYKSKNKREIDIQKYLKDIESSFSDLFSENNIVSIFSSQQMQLIIDDAMYVGLILTELYINSIKHAFSSYQINKQIVFNISLKDDDFVFWYMDNGQNSTNQVEVNLKPALVNQLCRQLEVDYELNYNLGFEFKFSKKISKIQNK